MRLTIDSNVLIYAIDNSTPAKHEIARDIMKRAIMVDTVLAAQALAEVLSVIARKYPVHLDEAETQVARWAEIYPVAATGWEEVRRAAALARSHRLQLWDSIIWEVARGAGASCFLSEDLQDGLAIDGMTVLNPFVAANAPRLAELLTPAPGTA